VPPPQIEEAQVNKLNAWCCARYSAIVLRVKAWDASVALRIEKWIRDRFYTTVLRSSAERVAGGLCTAAMIGMLVDPGNSGWASLALAIACGLLCVSARKPKGGKP